ncbi:hypothetical protein Anapl_08571 [Anas platyrhynchos]|uniref:Uncharacterized protein n=1 Tax=Anas platyrhynchos TaxID=8839 RepID=R0M514_ANAPL|nr:hypothetical protein Anapl_08571 [Anas platyrhynchos]
MLVCGKTSICSPTNTLTASSHLLEGAAAHGRCGWQHPQPSRGRTFRYVLGSTDECIQQQQEPPMTNPGRSCSLYYAPQRSLPGGLGPGTASPARPVVVTSPAPGDTGGHARVVAVREPGSALKAATDPLASDTGKDDGLVVPSAPSHGHSTPGRRHCPSCGSGPSRPRVQCLVSQKQAGTAVARGELTAPQSKAMAEPESSPAGHRGRHHGRLQAHARSFRKGKRQIIPTAHAEARLWLSTSSEVLLICIVRYLRRFDVAREVMVPGVPGALLRPGRPAVLVLLAAGRGDVAVAIQAVRGAAGSAPLPPRPHHGRLSQQQRGTQGTRPRAPIAPLPGDTTNASTTCTPSPRELRTPDWVSPDTNPAVGQPQAEQQPAKRSAFSAAAPRVSARHRQLRLPRCDLGFSPKAQMAKHKPSPARCVFLGSSRKRHKCRTRGRSLPSHPPPAGTESGNRRSCSTATRCSLHTASLRGDASSAPNHLGKMDAEDSRATPAVLETGRLHPGTVQALFECVSGAGFRSRRE